MTENFVDKLARVLQDETRFVKLVIERDLDTEPPAAYRVLLEYASPNGYDHHCTWSRDPLAALEGAVDSVTEVQ